MPWKGLDRTNAWRASYFSMEGLLQKPPPAVGLDTYCKSLPLFASQASPVFPEVHGDYLHWLVDWCGPNEDVRGKGLWSVESKDGTFNVGKKTAFANAGVSCVEQRKTQTQEAGAQTGSQEHMEEEEEEDLMASSHEPLTMVASLADCARRKDLLRGNKLHADIVAKGFLENNVFVGSALLNMYAKCGKITKAQEVFNQLPVRSVVLWNALIAGYTQLGYSEKALSSFEQMQQEGVSPDAVTFACLLKACGSVQDINMGNDFHALVQREGLLERNVVVANALVDMYAKCGLLGKAQAVFDELPIQDVVSWNVLILGYAQNGYAEEAFESFECMKARGFHPDGFTFVCIFKACASMGNVGLGQKVHGEIIRDGVEEGNLVIGSAMVRMYASCGMVADAQEVFIELPHKDVVAWTALVEGYVQQGLAERVFSCFEQMKQDGILPDAVLYACILKACGSISDACKGYKIHLEIVINDMWDEDMAIGTALLHMYADCNMLTEMQEVFDELPVRNATSWTSLIAIYAQHGLGEEALKCFKQMELEGFLPDEMTFACILKACSSLAALKKGRQTHAEIVKRGFLNIDTAVAGALVDMYAKCGLLEDAEDVFDGLLERDVVSWSALVSGYAQHGHDEKALNFFAKMQSDGFSPNAFTFASILKACGNIYAACQGQVIHAEIVRVGCLEDMVVGAALVDMYGKCGMLDEAQEVFNRIAVWDVFSWSALISGYARFHGEEALHCLSQMERKGFSPNAITFISILKACGSIGAAGKGQTLHAEIMKQGLLEENMFIGTALVDMYASCGMVAEAQVVFDKLQVQNLVTWNSLLAGYVLIGNDELAFQTYDKLLQDGKEPDGFTFILVLNACSNRGLVDKGQYYFEALSASFGVMPTLEHCTCIVDLFGRAGLLDYAVAVIKEMPIAADPSMWHSVLAACQRKGNVYLGQWAFEHAARMDERDGAVFVSMCNILYTSC